MGPTPNYSMEGILMANRDEVRGAQPYGPLLRARPYTASGTVNEGDPLKLVNDGTVVIATAGDACMGICLSYGVATDTVIVADHPDQEFVAQSDDGTIDAATDMNLNYNFVFASPNTTYRRSGVEIDGDTGATNSNKQAKVLRLLPRADNALGTNAVVIFKINNHQFGQGTGTLGV
jgi:hypothetical protein